MANDIRVRILGDAKSYQRAIGAAERSGGKFSSTLGKLGKVAAGVGVALGAGLAVAAKVGFDEFIEGQRVAAQTAAVLKSTGGAAKVTAKQVDTLATALMKKSGVDDEVIKSGENLLLTFTKIRNEAGKGNDIFDQATKASLDMSVALGTDMKQSAILVGKALNDPIRGMTAMRRVGISFTDSQADMVKKMVESGDTMGAQKLILRELSKEFGGSAEAAGKTLGGQLDILKQTFSNTAGEIVGRFVPVLVRIANFLAPLVLRGVDAIADGIDRLSRVFAPLIRVAKEAFDALSFGLFRRRTEDDLDATGEKIAAFGQMIRRVLGDVWSWVKANLIPIFLEIKDVFIAGITRIGQVLQEHEPELRRIWGRIGEAIKLLAKVALPILRLVFTEVLPRAIGIAITALDKITGFIGGVIDVGKRVRDWFRGTFLGFWRNVWQKIEDIVFDAKTFLITTFLNFADKFLSIADKAFGWLPGVGDDIGKFRKKIVAMKEEAERAAAGRYAIRFVTNAARVKSDIEDMRASLPRGDGVISVNMGSGAPGLSPNIWDELAVAQSMGLTLTSGYRPGAVTSTGNPSLHGIGKAIDVAGSRGQMSAFFRTMVGRSGIRELLYSPIGGWYGGGGVVPLGGSVLRDHFDHVHVGVADNGAMLAPHSTNLIRNNTPFWEPVGPPLSGGGAGRPIDVHVALNVDGQTLLRVVRRAESDYDHRNGGGG